MNPTRLPCPSRSRRGQSSVEFVILFGFVMFLFIVFFILIQQQSINALAGQKSGRVTQLKNMVLSEFDIATKASYGYSRTFTIPATIDGASYSIALLDNEEIVVDYDGIESVGFLTTPVIGNISKGHNFITKPFDTVYVINTT